jgi:frataxin-like iron-binding protein CyaY
MSHSAPIRSEDAGAIEQLQDRIAQGERLQATMRAANRIIRDKKSSDEEKVARLSTECGIQIYTARNLLKPDFAGRVGYPAFELTNNGANIRRMQERVEALTKESARPSVVVEFTGGRMEDNAEDSRVRIFHDMKPGRDVIQTLKSNGFHWSPSNKAWQRLRNDNARWAAARVTGVSWPETGPTAGTSTAVAAAPTVATAPVEGTPAPRMAV